MSHNKIRALRAAVTEYLRDYTARPALRLLDTDFAAQDDIASLLVLHHLLRDLAQVDTSAPIDDYLSRLLDDNPTAVALSDLLSNTGDRADSMAAARTLYCTYVFNLANWACVSTISASYLSAFIITRSLLEALVTVGANTGGTMSEKIAGLEMLAPDEQKIVSECWRELCGWAHPYRGWVNRLCPVLVAKGPLHHPSVVRECLLALGVTTDLAFAIALDKFAVPLEIVRRVCVEKHVEYDRFLMLRRRLSPTSDGITGEAG